MSLLAVDELGSFPGGLLGGSRGEGGEGTDGSMIDYLLVVPP